MHSHSAIPQPAFDPRCSRFAGPARPDSIAVVGGKSSDRELLVRAHNDPIHRRIILTSSGLFALHVATFLTPADRSLRSAERKELRITTSESVIRDARIEVEEHADARAAPPGDRGLSSPAIAFLPCVCCLGVACPTKRSISQPTHG